MTSQGLCTEKAITDESLCSRPITIHLFIAEEKRWHFSACVDLLAIAMVVLFELVFTMKSPDSVCSLQHRACALFELLLAIASEQVGTSAMKASQGFSIFLPTLLAVVGYLSSIFWFARSMKVLPMSFAYALWVGLGMIVASMIGFFWFGEVLSRESVLGLLLIAGGIFVLNSGQRG